MPQRGKLVILCMIAVAVAMSAYAWWHQYHQNPRAKQFWGSNTLVTIQYAPRVELLEFVPETLSEGESLDLKTARVVSDISKSPGLIHVRHALMNDDTYDWQRPANRSDWAFGLRFTRDDAQVTVAFDANCETLGWIEGRKPLRLMPASAEAFRKKKSDWQTPAER